MELYSDPYSSDPYSSDPYYTAGYGTASCDCSLCKGPGLGWDTDQGGFGWGEDVGSPTPSYSPTQVPTSASSLVDSGGAHHSRGEGRCGATPRINGRRTRARSLTSHAPGPDGTEREILLTRSSMRALEAEYRAAGKTWDHMVRTRDASGAEIVHYADTSTIRGGLPEDFPAEMREAFNQVCREQASFDQADTDTRREYRAALALALREAGYPPIDSPEYREVQERVLPLGYHLAYRQATPIEMTNLTRVGSIDTTGLQTFLGAGGRVQVAVDPSGSIRTAIAGGKTLLGWETYEITSTSYAKLEENLRCYTCLQPRGLCECGTGVSRRTKLQERLHDWWTGASITSALDTNETPAEHRWGKEWAVRPSLTDHARASSSRTQVEALMADALGEEEWSRVRAELGDEVGYDIALLCVQTSSDPTELLTTITTQSIVDGMRQADAVVQRFHPRHGHILHQTFDLEPSPRDADGKATRTEMYLGRDGVYMWAARMESQRHLRRHGLGTEDDIRYITASRKVQWRPAEHDHLLGDGHAEYVDTGFSGSIIRKILAARQQAGTGMGDGKVAHHARLLSSHQLNLIAPPLRGQEGMNQRAAYAIEHGPKPHLSAFEVGSIETPTGAVEQLLFRQTMRSVRRAAQRDSAEIIAGTTPKTLLGPRDHGGNTYDHYGEGDAGPAPWEPASADTPAATPTDSPAAVPAYGALPTLPSAPVPAPPGEAPWVPVWEKYVNDALAAKAAAGASAYAAGLLSETGPKSPVEEQLAQYLQALSAPASPYASAEGGWNFLPAEASATPPAPVEKVWSLDPAEDAPAPAPTSTPTPTEAVWDFTPAEYTSSPAAAPAPTEEVWNFEPAEYTPNPAAAPAAETGNLAAAGASSHPVPTQATGAPAEQEETGEPSAWAKVKGWFKGSIHADSS